MTSAGAAPRSIDYFVLRACERFGMSEREFRGMSYAEQVRVVAYERLREEEERGGPSTAYSATESDEGMRR